MYDIHHCHVGKFSCTVVIKPSLHIKSNTLHGDKVCPQPSISDRTICQIFIKCAILLYTKVVEEVLSFVKISAVTVILYKAV